MFNNYTKKILIISILITFLMPTIAQAATVRVKVYGVSNSDKLIKADTVMDVLDEYDTKIVKYPFGNYVKCVEGTCSSGRNVWTYLVNCEKPAVAPNRYNLDSDDYVIWFYGDYSQTPTCNKSKSSVKKSKERRETYNELKKYKKYKKTSHFVRNKKYYKKIYKRYLRTGKEKYYDAYKVYADYLKNKSFVKENPNISTSLLGTAYKHYSRYKKYLKAKEKYLDTIKGIEVD